MVMVVEDGNWHIPSALPSKITLLANTAPSERLFTKATLVASMSGMVQGEGPQKVPRAPLAPSPTLVLASSPGLTDPASGASSGSFRRSSPIILPPYLKAVPTSPKPSISVVTARPSISAPNTLAMGTSIASASSKPNALVASILTTSAFPTTFLTSTSPSLAMSRLWHRHRRTWPLPVKTLGVLKGEPGDLESSMTTLAPSLAQFWNHQQDSLGPFL